MFSEYDTCAFADQRVLGSHVEPSAWTASLRADEVYVQLLRLPRWSQTWSQGSCSRARAPPSSLFAATAAVIHRLSGTDASASPGAAARLVTRPSSGPWLKAGAGVTLCLLRFTDLPATRLLRSN